ncbi:MAG: glycosyl transferase family 2 [Acidobacteria bacterium]|nr:MAG: glycosyl transferase family 2 [Acidobacteriota bacterium]
MHRRRAHDGRALGGPVAPVVAAVLPAYRTAASIRAVIERIPATVRHVIVVDDASPDGVRAVVSALEDPRIVVMSHATNRGVGGAMKTGLERALELGADIVVKLDSDGQMDPELIPAFVAPLVAGRAELAKGNRFADLSFIDAMPPLRRIGNLALSFLVKAASGYWSLLDPCNGYLAISSGLLQDIRRERLADRYFFEISLLCESYHAGGVVLDVDMHPRYGDEVSSLSPLRSLFEFSGRLLVRTARRIGFAYFLRDFTVVSVFILAGVPLLVFGVLWSGYHWYLSWATNVVASTGTVIIGTLAIILAFQLLLQAVVLDVQNEPGRPPA